MLKLLKEAVYHSKYSDSKRETIKVLEQTVGKEKARRIIKDTKLDQKITLNG